MSVVQSESLTAVETTIEIKALEENIDVIFTSYFRYKEDPQRSIRVKESFSKIANLYNSVTFLGLRLVIFHDSLSDKFVNTYTTDRIRFCRVAPSTPEHQRLSTNDFRFQAYMEFLRKAKDAVMFGAPTGAVLFVDAFDVFF